jgi:hypothetical protein
MAAAAVEDAHHHAVVAQRRGLDLSFVLGVAEPLGGGLLEGHTRANHSRQRAALGLREDASELGLGKTLCPVAGGRAAAARPGWAEHPFDSAPVREPVHDVPLRAAHPLDAVREPRRRSCACELHRHRLHGLRAFTMRRAWDGARRAKRGTERGTEFSESEVI